MCRVRKNSRQPRCDREALILLPQQHPHRRRTEAKHRRRSHAERPQPHLLEEHDRIDHHHSGHRKQPDPSAERLAHHKPAQPEVHRQEGEDVQLVRNAHRNETRKMPVKLLQQCLREIDEGRSREPPRSHHAAIYKSEREECNRKQPKRDQEEDMRRCVIHRRSPPSHRYNMQLFAVKHTPRPASSQ